MKKLLKALLDHTLLRFAGSLVTLTLKSGAKIRFRADRDWSLNYNSEGLTYYKFTNARTLMGSPMTLWFSISDVVAVTVRSWRLF